MASLKNVIYLSNEDYETLVSTGTVTIDGDTLTYDENNVYITPDKLVTTTEDGLMSCTDKVILDTINSAYIKNASVSGNTLTITKQDNTTVTYTPTFTEQHVGDVVSVGATSGSHIAISGTTANPTVGVASGYSIPSTTDQATWNGKSTVSAATTGLSTTEAKYITINGVEWKLGGGSGTITDVQVNSTSVVTSGVANILTKTAYNSSSNKIVTESDLPQILDLRS